jgi:hypothetical protein
MQEIPTVPVVSQTLKDVFSRCQVEVPDRLLSALVPVNRHFLRGHKSLTRHLDAEMHELCAFIENRDTI